MIPFGGGLGWGGTPIGGTPVSAGGPVSSPAFGGGGRPTPVGGPARFPMQPYRSFDKLKGKAKIKKSGLYKLKKGEGVVSAKEMGKLSDMA